MPDTKREIRDLKAEIQRLLELLERWYWFADKQDLVTSELFRETQRVLDDRKVIDDL